MGERFVSRHTSAALAEKRMYDAAGACGLVADPSRGIALSPRSARPADPRTGLIVSHQRWDTTQAVSGCGGGSSWDRTPRWTTLIVVEDYLARTPTMYRITVGRTCSVP